MNACEGILQCLLAFAESLLKKVRPCVPRTFLMSMLRATQESQSGNTAKQPSDCGIAIPISFMLKSCR